jgi:hypothetical protein
MPLGGRVLSAQNPLRAIWKIIMTPMRPLSGIQAQQGVRGGGVFAITLHYSVLPFYPNKQAQKAIVQGTTVFFSKL